MMAFTYLVIILEASHILDVSCIDGWAPLDRDWDWELYYTRR
jgi:hypothetical protein